MTHLLALDAYLTDWLDLAIRWLHVIAGIAWIGTSFYFVALDNHLEAPSRRDDAEVGIGGETWEVHGGGFYRMVKFRVAPRTLPETLHWFKWEAYTTWLSGFALFVVLYYLNASNYLVDRSVTSLATGWLVAISIALLVAAWVVYDLLCRALRSDAAIGLAVAGLVVLAAWGSYRLFAPRAAWIQVGAMIGTVMAANVFFVIIPGQKELVRAKREGREPDPEYGRRGKQRSVHNNYLTLPVVLAMISNHFAFAYGRSDGWAVLAGLMAVGAFVRHYFNLRHRGWNVWPIPVVGAAALVGMGLVLRPHAAAVPASAAPVSFARVQAIVDDRCVTCHSMHPTRPGFDAPPKGIAFDTAQEIVARAQLIDQWAVQSQAMPLGNVTGMTPAERAALGAWIARGAHG